MSTDDFVEFVLDRAGTHVRSVLTYDDTSLEVQFLREDVADDYSAREIETVAEALRREGQTAGRQEHLYAHGKLNCIVRCFDGGLEMHFPHGEHEEGGIAVALEPDAAPNLYGFVDECLEHIGDIGQIT